MTRRFLLALALVLSTGVGLPAHRLDPLVYTISFPEPASKTFNVDIVVPTDKRATVDMMMAEFNKTVSDAAGFNVEPLLHKLIATTDEIDYTEMLDWYGLRFMTGDPAKAWTLEVRPDATLSQKQHFSDFLAHSHK